MDRGAWGRQCWADTRVESGGRRGCLAVGRLQARVPGRQQWGHPWTTAAPDGVAWPLAFWQAWFSWQPARPQTSGLETQNEEVIRQDKTVVGVCVCWVDGPVKSPPPPQTLNGPGEGSHQTHTHTYNCIDNRDVAVGCGQLCRYRMSSLPLYVVMRSHNCHGHFSKGVF